MNCPKCRYDGIRLAPKRHLDTIPAMLGWRAWRCGGCRHRFYLSERPRQGRPRKPQWLRNLSHTMHKRHQWVREGVILLAAFLIFLIFVKFLIVERASPAVWLLGASLL